MSRLLHPAQAGANQQECRHGGHSPPQWLHQTFFKLVIDRENTSNAADVIDLFANAVCKNVHMRDIELHCRRWP